MVERTLVEYIVKIKSGYTYQERFRNSNWEQITDKIKFLVECGVPVLIEEERSTYDYEREVREFNKNGGDGKSSEGETGISRPGDSGLNPDEPATGVQETTQSGGSNTGDGAKRALKARS